MTLLGLLNFVVLQFGVRLARVSCRACPPPDLAHALRRCAKHRRWRVLRWVWPLTGWWSDYRWIARRR